MVEEKPDKELVVNKKEEEKDCIMSDFDSIEDEELERLLNFPPVGFPLLNQRQK